MKSLSFSLRQMKIQPKLWIRMDWILGKCQIDYASYITDAQYQIDSNCIQYPANVHIGVDAFSQFLRRFSLIKPVLCVMLGKCSTALLFPLSHHCCVVLIRMSCLLSETGALLLGGGFGIESHSVFCPQLLDFRGFLRKWKALIKLYWERRMPVLCGGPRLLLRRWLVGGIVSNTRNVIVILEIPDSSSTWRVVNTCCLLTNVMSAWQPCKTFSRSIKMCYQSMFSVWLFASLLIFYQLLLTFFLLCSHHIIFKMSYKGFA